MSSEPAGTAADRARRLTDGIAAAEEVVAQDTVTDVDREIVSRLVSVAARLFAVSQEIRPAQSLDPTATTATEALTLVGNLMAVHNINAFDLALWLSHAGPAASNRQ